MSEMKLWAARDTSSASNLFRGKVRPDRFGGVYAHSVKCEILGTQDRFSDLACHDLKPGQCREIKTLDLINWTVEYVPDPPTLKEAWMAFKSQAMIGIDEKSDSPFWNLFKALRREFPDE